MIPSSLCFGFLPPFSTGRTFASLSNWWSAEPRRFWIFADSCEFFGGSDERGAIWHDVFSYETLPETNIFAPKNGGFQ